MSESVIFQLFKGELTEQKKTNWKHWSIKTTVTQRNLITY